MKWTKLGRIFDPTQHRLCNNCHDYAQSPQALALEDGVRIYFSTRERDQLGKFLSHVSYVEFDSSFSNITRVADHTVIPLGEMGAFDEHGIFPINVFKNDDEIWAYTTGWNRKVSVLVDGSIGLAKSSDGGRTFQRIGKGPVLTSSLHEPFLVGDGFVIKVGGIYHMWYIFGKRWIRPTTDGQPERVYKIAHATSTNGFAWEKEGQAIVADRIDKDECQALPSVLHFGGVYHMVFCYRSAVGFRTDKTKAYRLGHAYSHDLVHWIRDDGALGLDVSTEGWDSGMMCYPHLFAHNDRIWLLYNGNDFGRHGFGLALLES
jgi:hypothetical protein